MENEIELKIMLSAENGEKIGQWLNAQKTLSYEILQLGNTYYDTPTGYFSQHKMGLRVRQQNGNYELTLKTQGNILGGLHIRPEYNLPLENDFPDFQKLNAHFQLNFPELGELVPVFSTDFTRQAWRIAFRSAQIEVALDQGIIKNPFGESPICELELELKQGEFADLILFLAELPQYDGMWLSGLSKAQRGYFCGNSQKVAEYFAKMTQNISPENTLSAQYQFEQNMADYLRLTLGNTPLKTYLTSADYLAKNIQWLKNLEAK